MQQVKNIICYEHAKMHIIIYVSGNIRGANDLRSIADLE